MIKVDWEKAPEDATHFLPEDDEYFACWIKPGYSMRAVDQNAWQEDDYEAPAHLLIARHWSGEGMPPVGAVCEVQSPGYSHKRFDRFIGQQVTVVAHDVIDDDQVAVFRLPVNGDEAEQEYHALVAKCFRPVRTPEQIAAEERRQAVDKMVELFITHYGNPKGGEQYIGICEALHDAGYSKQEAS